MLITEHAQINVLIIRMNMRKMHKDAILFEFFGRFSLTNVKNTASASSTVMQYDSFSPDDGGIRNANIFSITSVNTGRRKLITEYKGNRLSCKQKASTGICSLEGSSSSIACADSSSHAPLLSKFVVIAAFDGVTNLTSCAW